MLRSLRLATVTEPDIYPVSPIVVLDRATAVRSLFKDFQISHLSSCPATSSSGRFSQYWALKSFLISNVVLGGSQKAIPGLQSLVARSELIEVVPLAGSRFQSVSICCMFPLNIRETMPAKSSSLSSGVNL